MRGTGNHFLPFPIFNRRRIPIFASLYSCQICIGILVALCIIITAVIMIIIILICNLCSMAWSINYL